MADCKRYERKWLFLIPSRAAGSLLKNDMSATDNLDDVPRSPAKHCTEFEPFTCSDRRCVRELHIICRSVGSSLRLRASLPSFSCSLPPQKLASPLSFPCLAVNSLSACIYSFRMGGPPKMYPTIQVHDYVFEAFAWEVPQKQDNLLNVTISVLGLRLKTVAKNI